MQNIKSKEGIKQAENKIRDLINLISVMNQEEVEGGTKKIEDSAANELKEKLREIAEVVGAKCGK